MKLRDITGQKFGKLLVLARDGRIGKRAAWLCKCDCGAITRQAGGSFLYGRTVSCGCVRAPDLVGQRFNRLVVLSRAGREKDHRTWRCRCDCGRAVVVATGNLRRGSTKSCGCLNREKQRTPEQMRAFIHENVRIDGRGCWNWLGNVNRDGYGFIATNIGVGGWGHSVPVLVHRLVAHLWHGMNIEPAAGRRTICACHRCDNKRCVYPEHIYVGTYSDNYADAVSRGLLIPNKCLAERTHCKNGHEFSPENTRYRPGNGRRCLQCDRDTKRSRKPSPQPTT